MGLIKAWKEAKAVLASGPPTGQRQPHQPGGMMAGFAGVMMKMAAPMMAAQAPERGAPFPGTEAGVGTAQDAATLAAAVAGLRARDSAFDGGVLETFGGQVFASVASAWGTGDTMSIRPLLADHLFEPISAALVTGATGTGQLFAHESAQPTLAGVWAGALYDSALISFAVSVDLPPDESGRIPPEMMHWNEEWLFQRSVSPGGDTTQAAATCPSCGAPAAPDADGLCTHCHQPIPLLTPGWLVTHIRSHNAYAEMMRDQILTQLRANPAQMQTMPDEVVRLLPAEVVAQIDPQRAAALGLHPH